MTYIGLPPIQMHNEKKVKDKNIFFVSISSFLWMSFADSLLTRPPTPSNFFYFDIPFIEKIKEKKHFGFVFERK